MSRGNTPSTATPISVTGVLLPSGGNDTTVLQAAIDAAYAAGGGEVYLGAGTFLAAGLKIKSNVAIRGRGQGTTVIKLRNGSNTDLITVDDFSTLAAGTTTGGPSRWTLATLTLDGNRSNNSSGWPLRVYGKGYVISEVEIKEGASGGVWSQWGTGGTDMESQWSNFRIHDNTGNGLDWHGPHDSQFVSGLIFKNAGKGIYTVSPATGDQFTNVHVWGSEHTYACHFKAPVFAVNCVAEGATTANVGLDCNFGSWIGGSIYGTSTGVEVGIQLGVDTTASYWHVDTFLYSFGASGKPIYYVSGSANNIRAMLDTSGGATQAVYGTPAVRDSLDVFCGNDPSIVTNDPNSNGRVSMGQQQILCDDNTRGFLFQATPTDIYQQMIESANLPAPSANRANIGVRDNGSGKTQLVVRFPTGAVQVIATEP